MDSPNSSNKILLVDDHPTALDSVGRVLRRLGYVVATAATAGAMWKLLDADVDLVILDISLPDANGLDLIRMLTERNARVLVLSGKDSPSTVQAADQAGAWGYMFKSSSIESNIAGIRAVLSGRQWFPAEYPIGQFVDSKFVVQEAPETKIILDRREKYVMFHATQGQTAKEISQSMGISVSTVNTYLGRVYKKLGTNKITAAVKLVSELQLLEDVELE